MKNNRLYKKIVFALALIFCFTHISQAQQTKEELTRQRQALVKEIEELNNSLNKVKGEKKTTLRELEKRKRKVEAIGELVNNINKKIKQLDDDLYLKQVEIYRLNKELDTLKSKYKKSIVYAYKNRSNYQYLNFLFSSTSFNDALKRISFLKGYRKMREEEANRIVKTQQFLQQNISQLNETKVDKQNTLVAQTEQLATFEQAKKEQEEAFNQIKGQEKDILAQLSKKEKERRELSTAITNVIKREREEAAKKEKERLAKLKAEADLKKKQLEAEALAKKQALIKAQQEKAAKQKADAAEKALAEEKERKAEEDALAAQKKLDIQKAEENKIGKTVTSSSGKEREYTEFEGTREGLKMSENFENNRRKLYWPVDVGTVCGEFGISKVAKIDVHRDGLDICLPEGTPVKCVADGVVSGVEDFGDYKVVMIRHGKYWTIYSKLKGIKVGKGQNINAGTVIGQATISDNGVEGEIEFMVMNGKGKFENPRSWLKPR